MCARIPSRWKTATSCWAASRHGSRYAGTALRPLRALGYKCTIDATMESMHGKVEVK